MFSCDTMLVNSACSRYGKNILAKNSDRPTGEPQPLCFYEGREYPEGATVETTHITIPQVRKTYSVVGSRPYWIWGFEMGYNEKGLVIGNEAEGSRLEPETEDGILGMDLLRLALERAANAREAIEVITSLLKKYGQKANASALTQRTYENTFNIVDKDECWILETAGREWAAKQVKTMQGISNCYSIGTDADILSENAERIAREKRWLSPDEPFDFAKAYSGRLIRQPLGVQRFRRLNKLLSQKEMHDFESLSDILRDHFEGELIEPRFGATAGTFLSICMHMREWGESETSASLLARYDETIGIIARYAPAQPCLSAYIPVYMVGKLPEKMQTADRAFDDASLWWQVKLLSLLVAVDEDKFAAEIREKLKELEAQFADMAEKAEKQAAELILNGKREEANKVLYTVTNECTELLYHLAKAENMRLSDTIKEKGGLYGRQKEVIEEYFEYADITF
ncbi:MAG: C69 family dipeptidase [Clostridia bacterium]|nr:C69 family dipeptidase [Clostridia bacterium]